MLLETQREALWEGQGRQGRQWVGTSQDPPLPLSGDSSSSFESDDAEGPRSLLHPHLGQCTGRQGAGSHLKDLAGTVFQPVQL